MASVTQTSLEALIMKATHESLSQPDEAAVEAFCTVLRDAADGPLLAAQAVAARMQSTNSREAMLALIMLDRCMRRCDANFHAEIGKFRFLNEMIKLVSPKYYAERTSAEVRTRVLQLLHAWSIEYPKETKFKVAFDMLKNQGVITETPPPLPADDHPYVARPREKSATFEDEEKSKLLRKLLRSKNPEDLQHANKLIKTMVREEERKNEANCRRSKDVGTAIDSAELLQDMLEHAFNDTSPEEEQLMEELYNTCVRYRPILERMSYGQSQAAMLNKILLAGDAVEDAIDKYDMYLERKRRLALGQSALLDFAGVINGEPGKNQRKAKNILDNMGIYDEKTFSCAIVELLKPSPENMLGPNDELEELPSEKEMRAQGWDELDFLGEQVLKQALPQNAKRSGSFNGKPSKKIPMNALEKSPPKNDPQPSSNGTYFDLDFFTKPTNAPTAAAPKPSDAQTSKAAAADDLMVDITINSPSKNVNNNQKNGGLMDMLDLGMSLENELKAQSNQKPAKNADTEDAVDAFLRNPGINKTKGQQYEVKPLSDIFMTLPSVQPSKVPPLTAYEEQGGISVVLHFCKNKPRADVYVIVISTTSKNSSPIIEYKFQAVVSKMCKVRLLTPSATSLPAYNPFLPPPALTQMMLIGRPPAMPVNLKFVLTYTCNDEMFSEMGEVDVLPLDQI